MPRLTSAPRRAGLSLTEVLIALFVMAIGMISLLALFPVGISNMHWALQDNRLALASANALAQAETVQHSVATGRNFSLRSDPTYYNSLQLMNVPSLPAPSRPFWDPSLPLPAVRYWTFDTQRGAFPPIYIDPIGTALNFCTGSLGYSVGTGLSCPLPDPLHYLNAVPCNSVVLGNLNVQLLSIPRVSSTNVLAVGNLQAALQVCSQEDDLEFDENGQPTLTNPGAGPAGQRVVQRERRYSWAYMCRWPRAADAGVVDMSVVIYNGRRLTISGLAPDLLITGEQRYPKPDGPHGFVPGTGAEFRMGSNQVTIFLGASTEPSPWKANTWILDNTLILPQPVPVTALLPGVGSVATFYYGPLLDRLQNVPVPGVLPNGLAVTAGVGLPARSGLASGHFYRVVAAGDIEPNPSLPGTFMQRLTIDRPAKTDGYDAVFMSGVVQVIEKNIGRMPAR
ncbi:MAG TPA: prepilin-type N-terminal cleavage/methylation domain-containing protein [Gemmatales bacterium]|nr:prepilin-type N-terminal cleavage/methylation domain-containing protein [Gemmatales bacterium]